MLKLARYSFILLTILVLSVYLPKLFDLAFDRQGEKTHLFFSAVNNKFIWSENVPDEEESELSEKHHAQFVLQDEDGNRYSRQDFEKLLPFIYFRNMELWGLLPMEIGGVTYTTDNIRERRLVLEMKPTELPGHFPTDGLYPLIESVPDEVRITLPENRFRIGREMEFVDADFNRRDDRLTKLYTDALTEAGFVFPGKFAGGRSIVLKPFDEGVFLTDKNGTLFHVKRVQGEPHVVKTGVKTESGVRFIKVIENSLREIYGLVLTYDGKISLLSYDNYRLIPLDLEGYDPETMDFKIISDPVHNTVTYSDNEIIRAVAFDRDYNPIRSYEHIMQGTAPSKMQELFTYAVPFRVDMKNENSLFLSFHPTFFPAGFFISGIFSLAVYIILRRRKANAADAAFVFLTGVYGLAAVLVLSSEE